MSDTRAGVSQAVAAAVAEGQDHDPVEAQLPLLPPEDLAALPAGQAQRKKAITSGEARGKGGRPPGSRNRRTAEMVDYLMSRYRDPLEGLAATFSRPVADLADELGCSKADAFKLQILAMRELAPFVHSKKPVAVELDGQVQLAPMLSAEAALAMWGVQSGAGPVLDAEYLEADPRTSPEEEAEGND